MKAGVYEIVNIANGKRYIGSTKNFRERWSEHRFDLDRKVSRHPPLQRAWNKYGPDGFEFRKLIVCAATKKQLLMYEQLCLDEFKPEYNSCKTAGSNLGVKFPPEFGAAITKRNTGRVMSLEQRKKLSIFRTGMKCPPEFGAAISARQTGKSRPSWSTEYRQKQSEVQTGKKHAPRAPEHCEKLSKALLGKPKSPEAVANSVAAKRAAKLKRLELSTQEIKL